MSDNHALGILIQNQKDIEGIDSSALWDGFLLARSKTLEVMEVIKGELKEGLSENEARLLSLNIFSDYGVKKHWHRPYIRFGEGTLFSFQDPISENVLKVNDPYHFDLGPVWPAAKLGIDSEVEYESDYGDTFIFGKNEEAEKMIKSLHEAFLVTKNEWAVNKLTGIDIYLRFKKEVESRRYIFVDNVDGHRISEFPHHKYTKDRLSKIRFVPSASLWILEAMIHHPKLKMGAFFEDIMH